jgi:hypothetical protein
MGATAMTDLKSTRLALRSWSKHQSPEITAKAKIIVINLMNAEGCMDPGAYSALLRQTETNVKALEAAVMRERAAAEYAR